MSLTDKNRTKWYNVHSWFLRGLLTAIVYSFKNVMVWSKLNSKFRRLTKLSIFGACVLIALLFYVKLNIDPHNDHELDSAQSPIFPCQRKPEEMQELLELFHDVLHILNEMNIRYFLIYGSVWGAFRSQAPLPWDYDIDLGIIGDEAYSHISKSQFLKSFRERDIIIYDRTMFSSCYYLTRGKFAQVDIDIFYNYNGWMQRTGLLTWFMHYNYQTYHRFPASLIKQPLPNMQFADTTVAVPRGGKTILKYLYPKDWDRPFTPAACLNDKRWMKSNHTNQ